MQKGIFLNIFFIALSTCLIKAEIRNLSIFKSPLSNQLIYIYGSYHCEPKNGREQLELVKKCLLKNELAQKKCHVLIERFQRKHFRFYKLLNPDNNHLEHCVLGNLCEELDELVTPLQYCTKENIECREQCGAAVKLLDFENSLVITHYCKDYDYLQYLTESFNCNVPLITFENVFEEVRTKLIALAKYIDTNWSDTSVQTVFNEKIQAYTDLTTKIVIQLAKSIGRPSPNQPILEFSDNLVRPCLVKGSSHALWLIDHDKPQPNIEYRKELEKLVLELSCILFDLNAFCKILLNVNATDNKIILFIGDYHRQNISKLLSDCDFKVIHEYIQTNTRNPLPSTEIELISQLGTSS